MNLKGKSILAQNKHKRESGIALILVLGVLAVLLILAVTFAFNMRLHQKAARNYLDYITADCYAKSGLEHAIATIRSPSNSTADYFDARMPVVYECPDGRFKYDIFPESGSLNLNFSGNLSDGGTAHRHNQGWTSFEISIANFLSSRLGIPLSQAEEMAGDIVRYRYNDGDGAFGGAETAGGVSDTYDAKLQDDGVDHDGSGTSGPADTDPSWFSEWNPRGGHLPFTIIDLEDELASLGWIAIDWEAANSDYTNWDEWYEIWDEIKDHLIVETRSTDELGEFVNINAVARAEDLRSETNTALTPQQAVNIIDYRDANHAASRLYFLGGSTYYGVESILINEVLANSSANVDIDPPFVNLNNTNQVLDLHNHDIDLAHATAFRVTIHYEVTVSALNPTPNYGFKVFGDITEEGAVAWQYPASPVYGSIDQFEFTPSSSYSNSSDDGNLYIGTFIVVEPGDPDDVDITITRVDLECAQFVELINIGDSNIDLSGWVITNPEPDPDPEGGGNIGAGGFYVPGTGTTSSFDIPFSGGTYTLTNDVELFGLTYGYENRNVADPWGTHDRETFRVAEVSAAGFYPRPEDGGNILILDNYGNVSEIAVDPAFPVHTEDTNIENVSRPGVSNRIGVSRERRDPRIRDEWFNNLEFRGSPGDTNTQMTGGTLADLYIKNNPFSNIVELSNVSSGNAQWGTISGTLLQNLAGECSTYYIRLDAEEAVFTDVSGSWVSTSAHSPTYSTDMYRSSASGDIGRWEWPARLNPGTSYALYIYGKDNSTAPGSYDLRVNIEFKDQDGTVFHTEPYDIRYKSSDGAYVTRLTEPNIVGGIFSIGLESLQSQVHFDYILLVPDSVDGKININAAGREVLMSLPGITVTLANNIIADRPFSNIGELLDVSGIGEAEFAPIANLVSTSIRETYRIVSTGTFAGPGDSEPTRRRIEAIVHESFGTVNVLSWRYLD